MTDKDAIWQGPAVPLIVGKTSCRNCGGEGRIQIELNILELIKVASLSLEAGDKIQSIKDVRARWDVGLKQAKEMVEAYQDFHRNLTKIIVPSVSNDCR